MGVYSSGRTMVILVQARAAQQMPSKQYKGNANLFI